MKKPYNVAKTMSHGDGHVGQMFNQYQWTFRGTTATGRISNDPAKMTKGTSPTIDHAWSMIEFQNEVASWYTTPNKDHK